MKLAEALQERADLNARFRALGSRLNNNCLVQEGEKTAEDPAKLLAELDACIARLRELTARINLTNARTVVNGASVTELIAEKDALHLRLSAYRDLVGEASQTASRATRNEIKIFSAVDVPSLQGEVDKMSARLRALENTIQQNNWLTELL